MTARQRVPNRRRHEIVEVDLIGARSRIGFFMFEGGGGLGEVFIDAGPIGSAIQAQARSCAILVSLLLQTGAKAEDIRHSLQKLKNGEPADLIGAALAAIESAADG